MKNTKLTYIEESYKKGGSLYAKYLCECGNYTITRKSRVKNLKTRSCGCLRKTINTKHGMSKTSEYSIWENMKSRCYNKKTRSYSDYGKRGIVVCLRWIDSFENFFNDMGKKPAGKYTLDRIDNNKNYSPDNCKWSLLLDQANNKRSTIRVTIDGKTRSLKQWCDVYNLKYKTVYARYKRGVDVTKIFN